MADVARLPIHSPEAPVIPSRRTALIVSLLLAALPLGASATPLGDLTALQRDGAAVTLTTSSAATVRLDFLRDDVLRLQAGPDGKLTDEGSGTAPIVLPQDAAAVMLTITDTPDGHVITTPALSLRIH